MASPTEKLVDLKLSYLTINDNGEPEEVQEEWYAYFTMGTFSKMYKKLGVPEDRAKQLAEEAQRDADSAEAGAEDFQDQIIQEVETTEFEANILLVWASLQWHARQAGTEITVEDVGDRITADNAEYIITQVMRALEGFQTGTVPSMEEIERRREEASEEEGAEGKDPSSGGDKSSPQS
jgi:hypothetical protein